MKSVKKGLLILNCMILILVLGACSQERSQMADSDIDQIYEEVEPKMEVTYTEVPTEEIEVGKIFTIILDENITTGYSWKYSIEDDTIIKLDSEDNNQSDEEEKAVGKVGVGSKHSWHFKALEKGTTKIIFKYYRSWEDEDSAIETIEYTLIVH